MNSIECECDKTGWVDGLGGGESGFVRLRAPVLGLRGKTGFDGLFVRVDMGVIRVSLAGRAKMGDGERTFRELSFGAIKVDE